MGKKISSSVDKDKKISLSGECKVTDSFVFTIFRLQSVVARNLRGHYRPTVYRTGARTVFSVKYPPLLCSCIDIDKKISLSGECKVPDSFVFKIFRLRSVVAQNLSRAWGKFDASRRSTKFALCPVVGNVRHVLLNKSC